MKYYAIGLFMLFALYASTAAKNSIHFVNNTPFTISPSAWVAGTQRIIPMNPIPAPREGTMNIEDFAIDRITLQIIDDKGKGMITKTFPTVFSYPSDLEVTAEIVDREKLLATPESINPTFNLTVTQKQGTGTPRQSDKKIPFGFNFTLEKPERLLVVNNTPYMANVATITDLRGSIAKTNIIKAYGEETITYPQSRFPVEGFAINLYAQNLQTPCLAVGVGKINATGKIGVHGIRPSFLMIVKEADGSMTVHEAITTPSLPKKRIDIIKEWLTKDYPIASRAYKRTEAVCEKP